MPSDIEKQFKDIEQLFIQGKFQEILKAVEKIETKDLTKEEELTCKIFRSDAIHKLGKHKEALQIVEEILKESKKLGYSLVQVDALLIKADAYDMVHHDSEKIFSVLENAKEILSSIRNIPEKVIAERNARLHQREAQTYIEIIEDYTKGIDIHEQGLKLARKSGNKQLITRSLTYLSRAYAESNIDPKKAEKFLEEAKDLAKAIENKFEMALIYILSGVVCSINRELKKAKVFFENSIKLSSESGSTYLLHAYMNLAVIYEDLGELSKALASYQSFLKEQQDHPLTSYAYARIGGIYSKKFDYDKALENTMKALDVAEKQNDKLRILLALVSLVKLFVDLDNLDLAKRHHKPKRYHKRLEEFRKEYDNRWSKIFFLHTSILVLKASTKMQDWIKALQFTDEILAVENLNPWMRYVILFFQIEIRFKELQATADPVVLEEVKRDIAKLQKEAEEKQFFEIHVNTYRLQSQLALLELNAKEAITLLTKAHNLAKEKNIKRLTSQILKEQENLKKQVGMWEELKKEDASLVETLKQVPLEKTIKEITNETSIEIRDEKSSEIIEYRKLFALKI
jgi:tetratricopeptide (TPR) repeat protein